jgi:hypothetical protein
MGAHTVRPPGRPAQVVPAQQSAAIGSHASPAATQRPAGTSSPLITHTAAPDGPTHAPAQQSSVAVHGAPCGAQPGWHASTPAPSTRQRAPQHSSVIAHGLPTATQPALVVPRQRSTPA